MRIVIVGVVLLAACSKSPSSPPPSSPQPASEEKPNGDSGNSEERPGLTASACKAQGGKVIGDIGDGAIHRPDYRCPDSGHPPIGSIVAEPGGPVAIEGAVCCK